MTQLIASFALWALARHDVLACRVRIVSGNSLPVARVIYVTVAGTPEALACAEQKVDAHR